MSKNSPKFIVGFELEGLCASAEVRNDIISHVRTLNRDIEDDVDGSLSGDCDTVIFEEGSDEDDHDLELKTPPLPLDDSLALFAKILAILNREADLNHYGTNETCGLHVNLSEPSMMETRNKSLLFYTHLIRLFPERDILARFDREANTYCVPLFARTAPASTYSLTDLYTNVSMNSFGQHKYHSVGMVASWSSAQCRRIEFRCLGGENYHSRLEDLHTSIETIIECATAAYERVRNPSREELEQYRKLKGKLADEAMSFYAPPVAI